MACRGRSGSTGRRTRRARRPGRSRSAGGRWSGRPAGRGRRASRAERGGQRADRARRRGPGARRASAAPTGWPGRGCGAAGDGGPGRAGAGTPTRRPATSPTVTGVAGRPERGVDRDLFGRVEELVETRSPDDPDVGDGRHERQATFSLVPNEDAGEAGRRGRLLRRGGGGGLLVALVALPPEPSDLEPELAGLGSLVVLAVLRAVAGAAVGAVEAGALEHDADGRKTLRSRPLQAGHTVSGSSLNFCTISSCSPHSVQAY